MQIEQIHVLHIDECFLFLPLVAPLALGKNEIRQEYSR